MFIWFAVVSVVLVAFVFRSPAIDYRTVILGSVLPVLEAVAGGPRVLHSLVGAVALLGIVMVATVGSRLVRRRLLGIPIGVMCHLVLDGSFTQTEVFWWPVRGLEFASGQIPELEHLGLALILEVVGVAVGVWAWNLFGLHDRGARDRFWSDGRLRLPDGPDPR
ncbi:MAG: hypothetical protein IPG97_19265 [Microthrixaceae bacterium]|nr:hypothetical protein [Microthrixaceae bacterium]